MSGVYIKGMQMPTDPLKPIYAKIYSDGLVFAGTGIGMSAKEAIPVPDHGRLIDADALVKENAMAWGTEDIIRIAKAPTIIPADKEGEA